MAVYFPEPTPQTKAVLKRLRDFFKDTNDLPTLTEPEMERLAVKVATICNAYHEHLVES